MDVQSHRRTRIIAEACANHLGDPGIQEDMIWAAAEAGADYIKFQSWQAAQNARGQAAAMAPFELSDDDHHRLIEVARKAGIGFSTTVFDLGRIPFVASLKLDFIKVASPDCGSRRFLEAVAHAAPKVILSTGMSEDGEVQLAASIFQRTGAASALLHCMYPLVDGKFHLRRMNWLRRHAAEVGLSDHSSANDLRASKLAIGMGADWLERHFILSAKLQAKDAPVSVDPQGLRELVDSAKNADRHADLRCLGTRHPELLGDEQPVLSGKVAELRQFYRGRWGDND